MSIYTKAQKKQLVKAFKLAKRLISKRSYQGICSALTDAEQRGLLTIETKWLASTLIMSSLEGHGYVTSWLLSHKKGPKEINAIQAQIYRRAWLDHLIRMYS